ncbi:hypothetical protein V2G26_006511 [Clonostachys chloroleuca]
MVMVNTQFRDTKLQLPLSPASTTTLGPPHDFPVGSPVGMMDASMSLGSHAMESVAIKHEDSVDGQPEGRNGVSPNSDEPARKRRRSRKGLDKRFECTTPGCGKSYSRAEHLYRHQLNHSSKQIFECQYPNCGRTFVRSDLLKRHMDRHMAKGSQLSRRDSVISHVSQSAAATGSTSPDTNRVTPVLPRAVSVTDYLPSHEVSDGSPTTTTHPPFAFESHHNGLSGPDMDSYGDPSGYQNMHQQHAPHSPIVTPHGPVPVYPITSPAPQYDRDTLYPPPSQFVNVPQTEDGTYSSNLDYSEHPPSDEMMILGNMALQSMPMFGTDGEIAKSPYAGLPEDFLTFLFNNSPPGRQPALSKEEVQAYNENYAKILNSQFTAVNRPDLSALGYSPAPQQLMAVNTLLGQVPESTISDSKCEEIQNLVRSTFRSKPGDPDDRRFDDLFDGGVITDDHMLSKRMMQLYIATYWAQFSDQMPILHRPTFSPDNTENLLLLSMMIIGAALLDRNHGAKIVRAGAKLSNFLAWHLRWAIFMAGDFHPPANLFVFQAMILLELYEKMYSTRELHERAHIHHATMIQLMRRGRCLIGKSALDSPPNPVDSANGSRQSSTCGIAQTAEEWWHQWIVNEATRRTAFAAFIIDSIHATMFGHSGVMVAHEMRLPLPCDESLWRATSSAEVGKLESSLMARGIKPVSFLDGLKRTLTHQTVQTDSFGRTVLMSGLLSVTWHMHQRDLQINMLGGGVSTSLGGRDKWRATLTRAYDGWKNNYDQSLEEMVTSMGPYEPDEATQHEINVAFENRTVMHRLAHIAMHADIVDLQMYARAKRLLGRSIGPHEFNSASRRIKDAWAPSARARDAMWYALKFLCSVLIPDAVAPTHIKTYRTTKPYKAKDDVLLNRPWVLYFAALVVWCYGYALEGPCPDAPYPTNDKEMMQQMREYLIKYGSIKDPNELREITGLNQNTAVLLVLKDTFAETRWELLHEGSKLLSNCITLNSGTGL